MEPEKIIFILFLTIMYTIILFGLYGNFQMIRIFKAKKTSKFNGLIITLAVIDILLLLFSSIHAVYDRIRNAYEFRVVLVPLTHLLGTANALTSFALSLERYFQLRQSK